MDFNEALKNHFWHDWGNESIFQAEIYYICKIRNIPILLDTHIPGIGRPDTIIIINNNVVILE